VSEFISYATGRCCCGKFNDLDKREDFIHNDIVHQLLGPEDNFCGHKNTHLIIKLKSRVRELYAELKAEKLSKSANAALVHEKNLELTQLRARHAALVGEVERIIGRIEFTENYPSKKDRLESILDAAKRLKAALEELK